MKEAGVSELADEVDSKSISGNGVRVQVPPSAFIKNRFLFDTRICFFYAHRRFEKRKNVANKNFICI